MLETETGHTFTLVGAPNIPSFELALSEGAYDFSYMNPYHLVIANEKQGYTPLVRDVEKQLFGVLVVHKESGITSPNQLKDREIAFPAPNALGASLQMRQELTDQFGIDFTPRYVNTHDSVYMNVILKQAAAGGGVQKTLHRQKDGIKNKLTIIHKTTPVSPHPFAVHPAVPDSVKQHVQKLLLSYSKGLSINNLDKIWFCTMLG